jgi:enamine deaminase RidA (YjgF/YER057c/UK114 family)
MKVLAADVRHRHSAVARCWFGVALAIVTIVVLGTPANAQDTGAQFINPPSLPPARGFTHVVVAADGRTVYIAGQVAIDSVGRLVGAGDLRAQGEQVFINLGRALASVGGTFADLVKTTTFITSAAQGGSLREVRSKYIDPTRPPANTLVYVSSLAVPGLLVEVEAIAVLRKPWRP